MQLLIALALVVGLAAALRDDTYSTEYDNIDIDGILQNDRLYKTYYDCLRNVGRCPPDAKAFKGIFPEIIETNCKKCNKKQRDTIDKVLVYLSAKKPEHLRELQKIYDPTGAHFEKYKTEAKKRGIVIP